MIIISGDPRRSHRPAEAVRVAAGLAEIGMIPIRVCFRSAAGLILSQAPNEFIDGDVIEKYLPKLDKCAKGIYADAPDFFLSGRARIPYERIGVSELERLIRSEKRIIEF